MTFIARVFPKLRTRNNLVRSMPKKSCFKGSFEKQLGKCAETLLKCQGQLLYHIYWSLFRQLSYKRSLLVTCKISRLFINTLSADGKYSLFNRDLLTQPVQMQVLQEQRTNAEKNSEKVFSFPDNCIWIGSVKLSLLKREYLSSALSLLIKSLEILHVTNRDFLQDNFLNSDQ